MSEGDSRDLVVVALAGVQRYITESRTTVDLRSASQIVAHLAAEAVRHLAGAHGAGIVFPAPTGTGARGADDGMPNRVVALVPSGQGREAAADTKEHLSGVWEDWVGEVFGRPVHVPPGWPVVEWVSVPAEAGTYPRQWERAQRLLAARKNVRDFSQPWDEARELCTLSPRWRSTLPPEGVPEHMRDETLAVANWVKRLWHQKTRLGRSGGFASTNAIASAPYRAEVLGRWNSDEAIADEIADAVGDLYLCARDLGPDEVGEAALPWLPRVAGVEEAAWVRGRGSRWVFPQSWNLDVLAREFSREREDPAFVRTVGAGWEAARRLAAEMADPGVEPGVDPLSPHLAVLVQDLDSMGRYLSGHHPGRDGTAVEVSAHAHGEVSRLLSQVAADQREAITRAGGTVVYAGGDDLLALIPAAAALDAARACQETIPHSLPTASTGLVFFHHDSSLRQALRRAQELLEEAKGRPGKHALGVGFTRHSGSHADCVLGWTDGTSPDEALRVFVPRGENTRIRLSPRLLGDLAAERVHLDRGDERERDLYEHVLPYQAAKAEMRRLVLRHTRLSPPPKNQRVDASAEKRLRESFAAEAVTALERMAPHQRLVDEDAVRVALFLRQEAP